MYCTASCCGLKQCQVGRKTQGQMLLYWLGIPAALVICYHAAIGRLRASGYRHNKCYCKSRHPHAFSFEACPGYERPLPYDALSKNEKKNSSEQLGTFKDYVKTFPEIDTPEIFGLHPNADLTFRVKEVNALFTTLGNTQPKVRPHAHTCRFWFFAGLLIGEGGGGRRRYTVGAVRYFCGSNAQSYRLS